MADSTRVLVLVVVVALPRTTIHMHYVLLLRTIIVLPHIVVLLYHIIFLNFYIHIYLQTIYIYDRMIVHKF